MASGRNAVFKYVLEIRDMLTKGRQVVQMNNQITGSTQKASTATDQYAESVQGAGRNSAAAAVNFQTMTQGMLNLSTAGIQTFTSISNLDRAGNRLAMSQIAVARAQDLLNNKQLRLNELMEKGGAGTQKATNLTNELATARADLLVKTDKLKIEEGALFDIQLLFVANIANVMISSIQTITTLRNLDIAATIKQTLSNKLLSAGLLRQVTATNLSATATLKANTAAKLAINTNRLLTLSIPVVGVALVGVTLAWEAYTENLGGFRDMVQSVIPMMKDQKKLLRDVQGELDGANDSAGEFNETMDDQFKLLIKLPDNFKIVTNRVRDMADEYVTLKNAIDDAGTSQQSFISNGQGSSINFRSGDQTSQVRTQNGSNVIKFEGDTRFTASGVNANSIIAGASVSLLGGSGYVPRTTEYTNQAGNRVIVDGNGNERVTSKQSNSAKAAVDRGIEILIDTVRIHVNAAQSIAGILGEKTPKLLSSDFGKAVGRGVGGDIAEISAVFSGFDSQEDRAKSEILRLRNMKHNFEIPLITGGSIFTGDIFKGKSISEMGVRSIGDIFPFKTTRAGERFINQGVSLDTFSGPFLGFDAIESALSNKDFRETQAGQELLRLVTTEPEFLRKVLLQDEKLGPIVKNIVGVNGISQKDFFFKTAIERSKRDLKEIKRQIQVEREAEVIRFATNLGLSKDELLRRGKIGNGIRGLNIPGMNVGIASILKTGGKITDDQREFLDKNNILARYGDLLVKPKKVVEAELTRELEKQGIGLPTDTAHDKLVAAAFLATNIDSGGRRGQFHFGSAGGTLGGTLGGLILSNDDPLLKDTSSFGESRLMAYKLTGQDIGSVADSLTPSAAKELAVIQQQLSTVTNTSGGFANAMIGYLNNTAANNSFGKKSKLNDLLSGQNLIKTNTLGRATNRTDFFGTGFFNSTGASGAAQVAHGSIKVPAWVAQQRNIELENMRRLRYGGTRQLDSSGFALALSISGAVTGGYTSLGAYRSAQRHKLNVEGSAAALNLGHSFGIFINTGIGRKGIGLANKARAIEQQKAIGSLLQRTGQSISYTGTRKTNRGGGYAQPGNVWDAHVRAVQQANQAALARGAQIDLLQEGFGLSGFFGAGNLGVLQSEVARQDELIKSIGLNRTEAFRIIDTEGRGRHEIDDRVLWTQRNNSISTGVAVI